MDGVGVQNAGTSEQRRPPPLLPSVKDGPSTMLLEANNQHDFGKPQAEGAGLKRMVSAHLADRVLEWRKRSARG